MSKSNFFKTSDNHIITLILVFLTIASFAISVFFYNQVPDTMINHWDLNGVPNGHGDKTLSLFIFPALIGFVTALYLLIPNIDPFKKNILKFEKQFGTFLILISTFFIIIQGYIIAWNTGVKLNPNFIVTIGIGVLMYYTGILLKSAKRNYFIGIRTPWTLSSDAIWDETHKLGSILFRAIAVIIIASSFLFKEKSAIIIMISVISVVIICIVHSYYLYAKIKKSKKHNHKNDSKLKNKPSKK